MVKALLVKKYQINLLKFKLVISFNFVYLMYFIFHST